MTGSAVINISTLPSAYTVTGGGSFCAGGGGVHVYLSSSAIGVTYQLYLGVGPVGVPLAGTGLALDFGAQTSPGSYTVVATNTTTGCTSTMTGSATIAVSVLPSAYTVTGGGSYCAGGTGFAVYLSGSTVGVNYQLYRGASPAGAPVAGTGVVLNFGVQSIAGNYTVVATNTTTGCMRTMGGSATITVNPLPTVYTMTGGGSYCPGGSGVTVGLSSSTAGVNYQLRRGSTSVGSPVAGTGSAISFGTISTVGTYTVVATNATTTCTSSMAGSAVVATYPAPAAGTISGPSHTLMNGATMTLSDPVTGGTWTASNAHVTVGATTGIVTGVSAGLVTVSYTVTNICGSASATWSVTETGTTPRIQSLITSGNVSVCVGAKAEMTNNISGGTWTSGNDAIATIDEQTGIVTGVTAGVVTITYSVNDILGKNRAFADVTVNAAPDVVVITATPGTSIKAGQKVSLAASVKSNGPVSAYQWSVNNDAVQGATSATFVGNGFADNDQVTCTVNGECGIQSISSSVVILVNGDAVKHIKLFAGSDIRIQPNPNKGAFTLKGSLASASDEEMTIEVTDVLGQVVYNGKIVAKNGEVNERVQLGQLTANGMYLVTLRSGTENKVFHIVVEQ